MALELLDIIKRYNEAKANEDDMIKDIELQKIQAEFAENNDFISSSEKMLQEKQDIIDKLQLDNERLRDSNAELRVKLGARVEEPKVDDTIEEKEEDKIIMVDNFRDVAGDF